MDEEELSAASAPNSALNSVEDSIRALYDSNTEFRRLIEEAFRIVEERLSRPKGLLLLRAARSEGQFNRLGASLARVAWYRRAREEGKTEPARRWAFKICDDEILSRACRGLFGGEAVVSGDGTLRISSILETPMSPEGRPINTQQLWDWLVKRFALQHGLKRSWELAFACALLGREDMPPFQADPDSRQKNRNRIKREKVRLGYKELDHSLKERLSRIEAALEAGDSVPPSVWRVLVAENIESYLESLSKKRHEAFTEYVECYAQLAETSKEPRPSGRGFLKPHPARDFY